LEEGVWFECSGSMPPCCCVGGCCTASFCEGLAAASSGPGGFPARAGAAGGSASGAFMKSKALELGALGARSSDEGVSAEAGAASPVGVESSRCCATAACAIATVAAAAACDAAAVGGGRLCGSMLAEGGGWIKSTPAGIAFKGAP